MVSRRNLLGISGTALAGSTLAGCFSDSDAVSVDSLSAKAITVAWRHENRSYSDQILQLHSDGESEVTGQVATEYDHIVSSPTEITVSEEVHEELQREFETVRYVLGVCGEEFESDDDLDCQNSTTSREDFDSVQFGDRAEVQITNDHIDIRDVESGNVEGWGTDIDTFEWTGRHAKHGQ